MKYITNRQIFQKIYDLYIGEYLAGSKYDVPIDLKIVAKKLGMNYGLLWGRFYYDININPKYRRLDNAELFSVGLNVIHFPMLYSFLSQEIDEYRKELVIPLLSITLGVLSVLISFIP